MHNCEQMQTFWSLKKKRNKVVICKKKKRNKVHRYTINTGNNELIQWRDRFSHWLQLLKPTKQAGLTKYLLKKKYRESALTLQDTLLQVFMCKYIYVITTQSSQLLPVNYKETSK